MLAAIGLAGLVLDFWFLGLVVESGQWFKGLLAAAAVPLVFPIGRGVIVDGSNRRITCWFGWVHQPVFHKSYDFSLFSSIEVGKKLGIQGGGRNSGRSVSRPVYLTGTGGRRVLLMTCTWVDGARALATEGARIMSLPVNDRFPNDEDSDG